MRKAVLAATIMLLAGCAAQQTYWVHTHNNPQRAAQDQLDCEQQALRMYPRLIVNQQITQPTQTPSTISCRVFGSNITCDEIGGRRDPGLSIPMDANNRLRGEAIATCLRTKGYQLMSNEQIDRANAANRSTPQVQNTQPVSIATIANIQPTFVDTYTGKWSFRYTGPQSGRCDVDIQSDGRFFGTCYDSGGSGKIGGSVQKDGRINALIESGATIEGRFLSPTSAAGQWKPRGVNVLGDWIGTKVDQQSQQTPKIDTTNTQRLISVKDPDQHLNDQTYQQTEGVKIIGMSTGIRLNLRSVSSSMTRRDWKVCHYESNQLTYQVEIMADKNCLPSVVTN